MRRKDRDRIPRRERERIQRRDRGRVRRETRSVDREICTCMPLGLAHPELHTSVNLPAYI
jgi:hypothetical protein